jgi:hypothetical protein
MPFNHVATGFSPCKCLICLCDGVIRAEARLHMSVILG